MGEPLSGELKAPLRFAGLILDLDACTLRRDSGDTIPLTRGEFALLRMFVSRPGRVLSRDALLIGNRRFEPFDRSVDVLVGRLRRKIEPDSKEPRLIVTVSGEGYRFDGLAKPALFAPEAAAQVKVVDPDDDNAEPVGDPDLVFAGNGVAEARVPLASAAVRSRPLRWAAIAALLALLPVGLYAWAPGLASHWMGTVVEDKLATAPRLSIVVLPFENRGGDPEQEYFADAITDDLTTDLSRLAESFVISRGTAFTYKGKPHDAKQIGHELGVRYVLEGSVRRIDDKIALNAQLVSTETGAHLWADRFEGARGNLGQLQVEFVSRLANTLGDELVSAESLRAMRERPDNPDAADLAMQGWGLINQTDSKERFDDAIKLFERALTDDSQNVQAMTGLALALMWRVFDSWSDDWDGDMARAERIVSRAIMLQPDSSLLHHAYANVLGNKHQWRAAVAENETAIEYDRNNAIAYAIAGFDKMYLGRSEEGLEDLRTALRLSPRDGGVPNWQYFICRLHNQLGRWEDAIEWCNKAIAGNPELTDPLVGLAAAHAWAGHDQDARDAVARIQKTLPGFTMQRLSWEEKATDDPTFKAQWARIVEGLRKAGLPEQ
jgi:TolB-like protein/DNA-binding winged helix-turn-helix (wHTH) protein/Flp pilus assembly protein TadD